MYLLKYLGTYLLQVPIGFFVHSMGGTIVKKKVGMSFIPGRTKLPLPEATFVEAYLLRSQDACPVLGKCGLWTCNHLPGTAMSG